MSNLLYSHEISINEFIDYDINVINHWKNESFLTHSVHWNKKMEIENLNNTELYNKINLSEKQSVRFMNLLIDIYFGKYNEVNIHLTRDFLTYPFIEEFKNKTDKKILGISKSLFTEKLHELLMNNTIRVVASDINDFKEEAQSLDPKEQYNEYLKKKLNNIEGLREFYQKYPTILRTNHEITLKYSEFLIYIYECVNKHYVQIKKQFNLKHKLTNIVINLGDTHEDGKSVAELHFGKRKLIFKPKNLEITKYFYVFLDWINQHSKEKFYRMNFLELEDFFIEECLEHESCNSEEEIESFYYKFGGLLSIIHLLNGNDIHYENLMAVGSNPVVVDLETLFNNQIKDVFEKNATNQAKLSIANSIVGTGMLPRNSFEDKNGHGYDLSALGSESQRLPSIILKLKDDYTTNLHFKEEKEKYIEHKNVPKLGNEMVNPYYYKENILKGFFDTITIINDNKDYLLEKNGLLDQFNGLKIRTIIRNTDFYSNLIFESLSPSCSVDSLLREMIIDRLYLSFLPSELILEEKHSLLRHEIPIFYTYTNSTDIYINGNKYENFYDESGIEIVKRKISELNDNKIFEEYNLLKNILDINSNLAIMNSTQVKLKNIVLSRKEMQLEEYVNEKCIEVINHSYKSEEKYNDMNWSGFQLSLNGIYDFSALNINYCDGLSGIFLLLLQQRNVELDLKIKNSILSNTKISNNIYSAFYDILSSLKPLIILHNRYQDEIILDKVKQIIKSYNKNIENIVRFDYFSGLSGNLSLFRDCYYETNCKALKQMIKSTLCLTETRLLNNLSVNENNDIGFSHGSSGIIYGLLRSYEISRNLRVLNLVKRMIENDDYKIHNELNDFSLSHGLLGILLSRALFKRINSTYCINSLIVFINNNYVFENHSLCNGATGFIEVCNILEDLGFYELNASKNILIKHIINSSEFISGAYNNVESKGLLLGETGFLYALTRTYEKNIINLI
ncbi:type 2 lanthipeptide synthetase LanM family protein [Staphylococcus equorum]